MDDMTPTDKLRALLDERGIEHVDADDSHTQHTWWSDGDHEIGACDSGERLAVYNLTPEQAIAATVGNGTDLASRLREVHGLHAFAELFGFSWEDGSDWDWHDVACAMADAIDATAGTAMTLDEAIEHIERFMGDYAKLLLESTLYVERDEPTDQHALDVAERKEAQMARDLAEVLTTVRTEPDEATMLKLHDRMNAALLDYESAMGIEGGNVANTVPFVIDMHQIIEDAATAGVRTCRNAVMCNQSDCVHNREYRCACTDLEIQDQECMTYSCRDIDYDEEEE